jgi:hypothetical protein
MERSRGSEWSRGSERSSGAEHRSRALRLLTARSGAGAEELILALLRNPAFSSYLKVWGIVISMCYIINFSKNFLSNLFQTFLYYIMWGVYALGMTTSLKLSIFFQNSKNQKLLSIFSKLFVKFLQFFETNFFKHFYIILCKVSMHSGWLQESKKLSSFFPKFFLNFFDNFFWNLFPKFPIKHGIFLSWNVL